MKRFMFFLTTLFFLFIAKEALPQAGQLDNTFGQGGIVTTAIDVIGSCFANSVAIQSDGKIVAAGSSYFGGRRDFAVVRYNTNGQLDNTFGTNGIVTTPVGTLDDNLNSVAIQSDGKIVAVGISYNGSKNDFAVVRYNTNGQLDNTFGTNGIVITSVGTLDDYALSVAIQGDGKIVAAGSYWNVNDDFAVVRYNTNGQLDNTFGTNGMVTTPVGTSHDEARSVAIQSDGKIVAAGFSDNGSYDDFAVVRYNTNGQLDNTFGTNGIVTTSAGASHDGANSVTIQSNGKIVAAGYSYSGNGFTVVRYNTNGQLDNTFGTNGIVTTPFGTSHGRANSVAIQSDGKIIVIGDSYSGNDRDFAVVRYNTNGQLDNTFGTNGIVNIPVGYSSEVAYSVAIQSDGKIVAAGDSYSGGSNSDFAVVRYNTDGQLDNTFGENGITTTLLGRAYSVAIQSDGKIVAAGFSYNGSNDDLAVVRYNTIGQLDNTFGTNGIVITPIGTSNGAARSVAIQSDGKIVAAGFSHNGGDNVFTVVRYNTNGQLDNTFGTNGIVTTSVGVQNSKVYSVAIQSDGKIVVTGYSYSASGNDFAVVRYNTNGQLDNTFGTNGIVTTPGGYPKSVAIQSNGKIVVGGFSVSGSDDEDFAVVRYNPDGALDNSFGENGIITTQIGSIKSRGTSMAIQDDGNIVVAGYLMTSNYSFHYTVFTLVRYLGDSADGIKEINKKELPASYTLEQNYPNPFNPVTNFEFQIIEPGFVTLKVYNVLGKEVATIVNKELNSGFYKYQWEANGLASGIYLYKINAGLYSAVKKMLLLK